MKIHIATVEYLRYLRYDCNYSEETMKTRNKVIGYLTMFWFDREIESITLRDITDLKESMIKRNCKPSYINKFLQAVCCILKFCKKHLHLTVLNQKEIEFVKVPRRNIEYLNDSQIKLIIIFFSGERLCDYRNRAIMATILDSGMRISECLRLSRKKHYQRIMEEGRCDIIGKGNKERVVFLNKWSKKFIKEYIERRSDDFDAMFINHCHDSRWKSRRLLPDGFRKYLRDFKKLYGFNANPHKQRKTAINNWKNKGMRLKDASLTAGHDKLETTEKYYFGIDYNLLQEEHEKYSNYSAFDDLTY